MAKRKWTSEQIGDQTGRVAVVTGANSGIGFETAKALAGKGATVVMACRNLDKAEPAAASIRQAAPDAPAQVIVMALDLADLSSVTAFAAAFAERFDRLDLLINNAGVMMPKRRQETADGFEMQIGTNHLGHFALTGQLLPLLRSTPGSRVVTVSSMGHKFHGLKLGDLQWATRRYRRTASYGASKLANLLFAFELQRRLSASGCTTLSVAAHPGFTRTNLQKETPLFRAMQPMMSMRPPQGALPSLYAATAEDVVGGGYYGPGGFQEFKGYPKRVGSNAASRDEAAAQDLWAQSEVLTGIIFDFATPPESRR